MRFPVDKFQNLIFLSAVPPPVAKVRGCQGQNATAFMAAWWSLKECTGVDVFRSSQILTKLSLAPVAKVWQLDSGDQAIPQIS